VSQGWQIPDPSHTGRWIFDALEYLVESALQDLWSSGMELKVARYGWGADEEAPAYYTKEILTAIG
jgi:hypothetical protein